MLILIKPIFIKGTNVGDNLSDNFFNDTSLKQKDNFEVSYYFFYDTYIISR